MIEEEVRKYLENLGFGISNIDLFDSFKPDSPDNLVVIEDVMAPELAESNALTIDNIGILITVRNVNKGQARNMIWLIHYELIGFSGNFITNGKDITYVIQENPPHSIGRDENNRHEYQATYNCRVQGHPGKYRL
jgi:hypothetical protein